MVLTRGRPKFSEPEIDVNFISEFKVCLRINKLFLHYKEKPYNAE
jgi:hypothetical protein